MNLAILAASAVAGAAAVGTTGPSGPTYVPAQLQTERACYLAQQPVRLSGTGFAPGAAYSVALDRRGVGSGTVRADGSLAGTLSSGPLTHGASMARRRVAVHDGQHAGHAAFDVSAFGASYSPSVGDPRTLRVRFSVLGIGIAAPAGQVIYLHYLDPRGHLLRTVAVGRASGPCGNLTSGSPLRLFPFSSIRRGGWRLQFDLRRSYSAGAQPRIVRLLAVR